MPETKAHAEWVKNNTQFVGLRLNHRTDADIIRRLDSVASKQGYIKQAIREMMRREKSVK